MSEERTFPKARGVFVAGTDTGVGKTLITGALARLAMRQGKSVGVFKAVATGCVWDGDQLRSDDAIFLSHCVAGRLTEREITPVCYEPAVAPMTAVAQTGVSIDWPGIAGAYRSVVESHEMVFVEGIGGVMVPFSENDFVLDLMADLGLPVLIVARASLGTINHTLLTVRACHTKGLGVCGILLNSSGQSGSDESRRTNRDDIAKLSGVGNTAVIDYCKSSCVKDCTLGSALEAQLAQVQWIKELIHIQPGR